MKESGSKRMREDTVILIREIGRSYRYAVMITVLKMSKVFGV